MAKTRTSAPGVAVDEAASGFANKVTTIVNAIGTRWLPSRSMRTSPRLAAGPAAPLWKGLEAQRRVENLYRILTFLLNDDDSSDERSPYEIRAWLMGMNPHLDDESPAERVRWVSSERSWPPRGRCRPGDRHMPTPQIKAVSLPDVVYRVALKGSGKAYSYITPGDDANPRAGHRYDVLELACCTPRADSEAAISRPCARCGRRRASFSSQPKTTSGSWRRGAFHDSGTRTAAYSNSRHPSRLNSRSWIHGPRDPNGAHVHAR